MPVAAEGDGSGAVCLSVCSFGHCETRWAARGFGGWRDAVRVFSGEEGVVAW